MRLSLNSEENKWVLSGMEEVHVQLLRQAAEDASMTDCPEGRKRLFPSPVAEDQTIQEGEFLEDWSEYVTDELDNQFAEDVGTLLTDLDAIQVLPNGEDHTEPLYTLELPMERAGAWFSALNQARLMLDTKFNLHPNGEEFDVDLPADLEDDSLPHERLAAYMRYEFFALIQEWIVRHAMQ